MPKKPNLLEQRKRSAKAREQQKLRNQAEKQSRAKAQLDIWKQRKKFSKNFFAEIRAKNANLPKFIQNDLSTKKGRAKAGRAKIRNREGTDSQANIGSHFFYERLLQNRTKYFSLIEKILRQVNPTFIKMEKSKNSPAIIVYRKYELKEGDKSAEIGNTDFFDLSELFPKQIQQYIPVVFIYITKPFTKSKSKKIQSIVKEIQKKEKEVLAHEERHVKQIISKKYVGEYESFNNEVLDELTAYLGQIPNFLDKSSNSKIMEVSKLLLSRLINQKAQDPITKLTKKELKEAGEQIFDIIDKIRKAHTNYKLSKEQILYVMTHSNAENLFENLEKRGIEYQKSLAKRKIKKKI